MPGLILQLCFVTRGFNPLQKGYLKYFLVAQKIIYYLNNTYNSIDNNLIVLGVQFGEVLDKSDAQRIQDVYGGINEGR
jgi:hypothetical protein|tara:strand:- start:148 stop:381 length:234 start_codon:yes stop_codon:yes gene_type:complete